MAPVIPPPPLSEPAQSAADKIESWLGSLSRQGIPPTAPIGYCPERHWADVSVNDLLNLLAEVRRLHAERGTPTMSGKHLATMLQLLGPEPPSQIAAAFCRHWAEMLRCGQPWDTPATMARCLIQVATILESHPPASSSPAREGAEE